MSTPGFWSRHNHLFSFQALLLFSLEVLLPLLPNPLGFLTKASFFFLLETGSGPLLQAGRAAGRRRHGGPQSRCGTPSHPPLRGLVRTPGGGAGAPLPASGRAPGPRARAARAPPPAAAAALPAALPSPGPAGPPAGGTPPRAAPAPPPPSAPAPLSFVWKKTHTKQRYTGGRSPKKGWMELVPVA